MCICPMCGNRYDCCPAVCRIRAIERNSLGPNSKSDAPSNMMGSMKKTKSIKELLNRPSHTPPDNGQDTPAGGVVLIPQPKETVSFERETLNMVGSDVGRKEASPNSSFTASGDKRNFENQLRGVSFSFGRRDSNSTSQESNSGSSNDSVQVDASTLVQADVLMQGSKEDVATPPSSNTFTVSRSDPAEVNEGSVASKIDMQQVQGHA